MKKFNCDFSSRFRILKGGKISLVVSALLGSVSLSFAAPSGGVVTSGSATISQSGNTTNITQSTAKATINWNSFSIASNETVNFNQPSKNAITLNRVIGNERSIIDGALNANGQVWILNSNGILFNSNAKINTAGIIATTKNISDADFNASKYKFSGGSSASVINMGEITANDSGYVAMLANTVQNNGTIKAYKGTVHLTGASEATINLNGNSIVSLTVNKGVLDALVENKNIIQADGGKIYLTTNAVDELLRGVVNNTGVIEAKSIDDMFSEVVLFAHGGTTNISGSIIANGGFVETSGKTLNIADGTKIKAKTWLIDPTDITVESTGSTTDLTSSSIKASFIESVLNSGTGVILQADNDITINESISWNQSLFTLRAGNDINIFATLTPTGTSTLDIGYGYNGSTYGNGTSAVRYGLYTDTAFRGKVDFGSRTGNGILSINGNDYWIVNTIGDYWTDGLSKYTNTNIAGYAKDYVALGSDLDASAWANNYSLAYSIASGRIVDGLGHTISNFSLTNPSQYTGVFGSVAGTLKNIGFSNININATIAGYGSIGAIYATGTVTGVKLSGVNSFSGQNMLGGIAGYNAGTLNEFTLSGTITLNPTSTNNGTVGGAVGNNGMWNGTSWTGAMSKGYSEATVSTSNTDPRIYLGGFIGRNTASASYLINNGSINLGDMSVYNSTNYKGIGGIIGENGYHGTYYAGILLSHSEFSGTITIGTNGSFVGGLVGYNHSFIESSTNSGTITVGNGSDYVGGIAGANYDQWSANTPTIQDNNSFTGTITAGTNSTKIGGISGYNSSNGVITAFDSSGTLTAGSGSTYIGGIVGQDANNANGISDGFSATSVSVGGVSATVDKGATSPYIGRLVGNGGTQDGTISYKTLLTFTLSDILSGYVYNGQSQLPTEWTASSIFGSSYSSWDLGTDYKLTYNNTDTTGFTNAGTYSGISVEIINTGFVKSSTGNTTGSFTIDKAPLSVTALDDTKTYDGVAYSGGNGVSYNGFVNGEGVSELGGTLAYGGTSQGAVNSGDYTIVPSGLTASNYELSYIGGELSIVAPTPTPTPIPEATPTPDATLPSESSIDTDATIISTPDIESNTQDPTPDIPVSDEALEVVEIKKIEQVIASIVNTQQIKVEVPKIHIPKVEAPKQNIKLPTNLAVKVGVNDGEKVSVVSSPLQSQQIQKVTMSELVDTNQEESSDNKTDAPIIKDIKVAIGENSIVQLINGGVSLPQGLEQEFYIVKSNQRGTN